MEMIFVYNRLVSKAQYKDKSGVGVGVGTGIDW